MKSVLNEFELVEALESSDPWRLLVIGRVLMLSRQVILVTAGLERICVPFAWFEHSGTTSPNFDQLEIIDSGQTVKLGEYEASSDAILEEFSVDYKINTYQAGFDSQQNHDRLKRRNQ